MFPVCPSPRASVTPHSQPVLLTEVVSLPLEGRGAALKSPALDFLVPEIHRGRSKPVNQMELDQKKNTHLPVVTQVLLPTSQQEAWNGAHAAPEASVTLWLLKSHLPTHAHLRRPQRVSCPPGRRRGRAG